MIDSSQPPGRTFRFACPPQDMPLALALLAGQGYAFEPEPFWPLAARLTAEPRPLGSSVANFFGFIHVQDKSSMLPPLLLAPARGEAVLDLCASPGSKTGQLAQLVGPEGFVLGNEPGGARLETLRRTLERVNALPCATCSFPGQEAPLAGGRWPFILLDPPCSGLGTLDKHPEARRWQGARAQPLERLQRDLLARASALLAPGGVLLYSTCTTSPAENEVQTAWALDALGLELEPLAPPPGFVARPPALPGLDGVLPVDGDASGAQGFYLARLRRPGAGADPGPADAAGAAGAAGAADAEAEACAAPPPRGRLLDAAETAACAEAGAEFTRLPPGELRRFGDALFLVHRRARGLLSPGLPWQGLPLGRFQAGRFRPNPRLRAILPADPACAVHADSAQDIARLLTGQALPAPRAPFAVLHFQGRPVCRLAVKGSRALWAGR
jgi:16S rRNA (cytosine1407-C5)-methyltransferase